MSRRAAAFTQADVARAIRAVKQVNPGPVMVEIAPGRVVRVRPDDRVPASTAPADPIAQPESDNGRGLSIVP